MTRGFRRVRDRGRAQVALGAAAVVAFGLFAWNLALGVVKSATSSPILPPAGHRVEARGTVKFAVVGDSRGNMSVFEKILLEVAATDVSFIIHTGDIVHRPTQANFRWVLHELHEARLRIPICFVPGNHDVDNDAPDPQARCALYTAAFGPRRYWFAWGDALFVAFDDSARRCTAADIQWLDRLLAKRRGQFRSCFVFMHLPPRDPRPGSNHALKAGAEELVATLKKHSVTAVFASHIHSYLEDRLGGIPIYISGGAGARPHEPYVGNHYLLCTLSPDGALTVERRAIARTANHDAWDYFLMVRWPDRAAAWASLGVCVAGLVVVVAAGRKRRRPGRVAAEREP